MGALATTLDGRRLVVRAAALTMLCAGATLLPMVAPAAADRVTVGACEADAGCEEVAGLADLPPASAMAAGTLTSAGSTACNLAFGHERGLEVPVEDGRVLLCGEQMVAGMVYEREVVAVELGDLAAHHESGGHSFGTFNYWGSYRVGDRTLIISSTERHWSDPWP